MKKSLSELFVDLSLADVERRDEVTILHIESMTNSAVIAIQVTVANEEVDQYDLTIAGKANQN